MIDSFKTLFGGSGKKLNHYEIMLTLLFLASVFLLALNKIADWDAWLHLSMGRAIFEHRGIPQHDPYVYTRQGEGFGDSSWLFGLIYYMTYRAFNLYGVILFKALTIATAFYILFRDSLRPHRNYIIAIVVMTGIIFVSRHRFVERPDTFLMVFLSFSVFSLNAFIYDNKKYIYALPFIHLLWANSHTSVILMVVPFLSFIGGGILQLLINGFYGRRRSGKLLPYTPSLSKLMTIALIFAASYGATLITPYYSKGQVVSPQVAGGAQYMSVDWYKQEILELHAPTWEIYKAPYILTALVLLSFVINWFVSFLRFRNDKAAVKMPDFPPLIHLFLVLPFIYLAFTAGRFIFLLAMITGPILVRNLSALFVKEDEPEPAGGRGARGAFRNRQAMTAVSLLLVLFTTLTIAQVEPFGNRVQIFGFGINYDTVPEGALRYMDGRDISGRVFNLYQWGQYITWRDFPKRAPFIDGRGLASKELLEKAKLARVSVQLLDELYNKYGFESILLDYMLLTEGISAEAFSDTDLSLRHPGWALVYWDDTSLLYLKRGGKYDSVIKEDEYRYVRPGAATTFYDISSSLHEENYRINIIGELKRNISETGSSRAHILLGHVYNETGFYKEAIDVLSGVRDIISMTFLPLAYNGIASAYDKLGNIDESIRYMEKSLSIYKKQPLLYYYIGSDYIKKNDARTALKYLRKALELNRNFTSIYPILIGLYEELGMAGDAAKTRSMLEKAKVFSESETHFNRGVQAYLANDVRKAAGEFEESIKVMPSNPVSYSNLGFIYYDLGAVETAFRYQKNALDTDPNYANAYYGLALIYRKWGDNKSAKKYWEEYLRLEPAGYYSRRAKEAIQAIDQNQ